MIQDYNDENILFITHSGVIMTIMSFIYNSPFEEMTQYKTENTSITKICSHLLSENISYYDKSRPET